MHTVLCNEDKQYGIIKQNWITVCRYIAMINTRAILLNWQNPYKLKNPNILRKHIISRANGCNNRYTGTQNDYIKTVSSCHSMECPQVAGRADGLYTCNTETNIRRVGTTKETLRSEKNPTCYRMLHTASAFGRLFGMV